MEKENQYRFEIIPKNWAMRRKPVKEPEPVSVTIPDFKCIKNHSCTMHVTYNNNETKTYLSRVLQNHITQEWKVDGMHVAVRVVRC